MGRNEKNRKNVASCGTARYHLCMPENQHDDAWHPELLQVLARILEKLDPPQSETEASITARYQRVERLARSLAAEDREWAGYRAKYAHELEQRGNPECTAVGQALSCSQAAYEDAQAVARIARVHQALTLLGLDDLVRALGEPTTEGDTDAD
ncbi:MAG: hypothetical protein GWN29_05000 [Gammaproteobacteria bacterium]|nr:hypothetical protein [Gammaproteobacteria bacterium]